VKGGIARWCTEFPAKQVVRLTVAGLPPFLLADAPDLVRKINEDIMANLQIEQTPIYALRGWRQNARTHSKRQIRQIANSIKRFGFCNPILVDDELTILAGHGRVAAAQLLNLSSVPTVRLSHLSEADKCAYVIADNRFGRKSRLGSQPAGH
jgi:ParB/Sulfiredoxin domain